MRLKQATAMSRSELSVSELSFRMPMTVTEVMVFTDKESYAVCPQCKTTLPREYMRYCDRCGQHLCWKHFGKAAVVFVKK